MLLDEVPDRLHLEVSSVNFDLRVMLECYLHVNYLYYDLRIIFIVMTSLSFLMIPPSQNTQTSKSNATKNMGLKLLPSESRIFSRRLSS